MTDSARKPPMPTFGVKTMVPTLNGTGFMFEVRDGYAEEWIHYAGRCPDPVLEIGCAYGVSTIPALEAGGRVTACDMEQGHLDILADRVPESLKPNLACVAGALPDVDFPRAHYGAILCSRVLHFLTGEQIDESVAKMAAWLKPGGRLYLVADTPYGIWRNFIPTFEQGKKDGVRWPGMMVGLHNWLPTPGIQKHIDKPPFMNLLDVDLLARTCTEAGLTVKRASFIDRPDFKGLGSLDGRENAGVLAVKPLP
jgi:SAM-dependent methyltransferase